MDTLKSIMSFLNEPVPSFFFGVLIVDIVDNLLSSPSAVTGLLTQMDPTASAFTEVSGLELGLNTTDWEEGGNQIPLKLPGRMKNETLTLKRYLRPRHVAVGGFALDPLTGWAQETFEAAKSWETSIVPKNIIVVVYHPQVKSPLPVGSSAFPVASYMVERAYPIKWATGDLNSTSEDPIPETFEFAYSEISRVQVPPV